MDRQSNEVDLLELLAKLVLTLKRNTKIILTAFIFGALLGLAYYQLTPKIFSSRMVVTSDIVTESYGKNLFAGLESLLIESNTASLAQRLNITEDQAKKISSIKIKNAIEKSEGIQEDKKIFLAIEVRSVDNTIWKNLERGILNFLENNEFVKIRVEQRKRLDKEMISKLIKEIDDLEKLKIQLFEDKTLFSKGGTLQIDPTTLNSKIIDLNKEKLNYENALEIANSIQVVEGFIIFNEPIAPKLSISVAAGISIGLFFVAIVIIFKGIRSMIRFSEQKLGQS